MAIASVVARLWATERRVGGGADAWLSRGVLDERDRGGGGAKQAEVLEALARRALSGRALLRGNLVRLPLLGTSAFFQIERVESDARGAGGPGAVGVVDERTKVTLRPRGPGAGGGWRTTSARASPRARRRRRRRRRTKKNARRRTRATTTTTTTSRRIRTRSSRR